MAGAGHDLYVLRPGFGTVTITDTDRLGKLVYEDASGAPLGIKDAFMYYTDLPRAA